MYWCLQFLLIFSLKNHLHCSWHYSYELENIRLSRRVGFRLRAVSLSAQGLESSTKNTRASAKIACRVRVTWRACVVSRLTLLYLLLKKRKSYSRLCRIQYTNQSCLIKKRIKPTLKDVLFYPYSCCIVICSFTFYFSRDRSTLLPWTRRQLQ